MKFYVLFALILIGVGACTKEAVRDSISHSLAGACRNNAGQCTVIDNEYPTPNRKESQ